MARRRLAVAVAIQDQAENGAITLPGHVDEVTARSIFQR
jgi:hypothetical protein